MMHCLPRSKNQGFSLIELAILLSVIGIVGVALMMGYIISLQQMPKVSKNDMAANLAEGRMAVILGQFQINGFSAGSDPCVASPSLAICSVPENYTVSSSITANYGGNSYMKLITVTVSGLGDASLQTLVTDHQ